MRCNEPIKIKLYMPIPIDKPDGNKITYTKEAVINAVKKFKNPIPLVTTYKENTRKVIGTINGLNLLENNIMELDGIIFFGGTDDNCEQENRVVKDMEIILVGIDTKGVDNAERYKK